MLRTGSTRDFGNMLMFAPTTDATVVFDDEVTAPPAPVDSIYSRAMHKTSVEELAKLLSNTVD